MMRAKKVFEIKRSGDAIPLIGVGRSVIAPAYDNIMRTWPNWFNEMGLGDLSESNIPYVNAFTRKACEVMSSDPSDIMLAWWSNRISVAGSPENYIRSFFMGDHVMTHENAQVTVAGNALPVTFRHVEDMGIAEVSVSIPVPNKPLASRILKYYLIRK